MKNWNRRWNLVRPVVLFIRVNTRIREDESKEIKRKVLESNDILYVLLSFIWQSMVIKIWNHFEASYLAHLRIPQRSQPTTFHVASHRRVWIHSVSLPFSIFVNLFFSYWRCLASNLQKNITNTEREWLCVPPIIIYSTS